MTETGTLFSSFPPTDSPLYLDRRPDMLGAEPMLSGVEAQEGPEPEEGVPEEGVDWVRPRREVRYSRGEKMEEVALGGWGVDMVGGRGDGT